ncbi:hypothetical protein BKA82DRAFT_2962701 [Pisolithus tinctorius]|nr:hypothetical protein BKA82DRAFT_2962701 [Pisolithus tinctorius]
MHAYLCRVWTFDILSIAFSSLCFSACAVVAELDGRHRHTTIPLNPTSLRKFLRRRGLFQRAVHSTLIITRLFVPSFPSSGQRQSRVQSRGSDRTRQDSHRT